MDYQRHRRERREKEEHVVLRGGLNEEEVAFEEAHALIDRMWYRKEKLFVLFLCRSGERKWNAPMQLNPKP